MLISFWGCSWFGYISGSVHFNGNHADDVEVSIFTQIEYQIWNIICLGAVTVTHHIRVFFFVTASYRPHIILYTPCLFLLQLVLFGLSNQVVVTFKEENTMTFKHIFLKDYDESSDDSFAVYTQKDVYDHIFYAVEQVIIFFFFFFLTEICNRLSLLNNFLNRISWLATAWKLSALYYWSLHHSPQTWAKL